jgi:L-lactate utilization protein LutC
VHESTFGLVNAVLLLGSCLNLYCFTAAEGHTNSYETSATGLEHNIERALSHHSRMPILTPSKKLFVNLGIQVEVTPIISRRWR